MKSETSFEFYGDLILVEAVVVGPLARASVQLLVDTGAELTTLVPAIATLIGYPPSASLCPTTTRTAVAHETGYLVQLVELSTLGFTTPGAHVNVADLGYGVEGVLGLNFLLDYNVTIRPREQRIILESIER